MKQLFFLFFVLCQYSFGSFISAGGNATQLQGNAVSSNSPSNNQCLVYSTSSTNWAPGSCSSGSGIGGSWTSTGNVVTTDGTNTAQDSGTALTAVCTLTGTQTLTNKTLTSPAVAGATWSGTTATGQGNSKILETDASGNLTSAAGVTAAQLPNPTVSALGGIEAIVAVSHNWINAVNTSGVPQLSQPAYADLSAMTGFVEEQTGFIPTPGNQTYVLDAYAAYAYTITNITIYTTAGTITAEVAIGGTAVTSCSALSVSSSSTSPTTCTAANSVSATNAVTLVLSSNSSSANLAYTMKVTRQ